MADFLNWHSADHVVLKDIAAFIRGDDPVSDHNDGDDLAGMLVIGEVKRKADVYIPISHQDFPRGISTDQVEGGEVVVNFGD